MMDASRRRTVLIAADTEGQRESATAAEIAELRAKLAHEVQEREWFAEWHSKLSEMTLEEQATKLKAEAAVESAAQVEAHAVGRKRSAVASMLDRWRCASAMERCADLERENRALADRAERVERRADAQLAMRSVRNAQDAMVERVQEADRTLQRSRSETDEFERMRAQCEASRRATARAIVGRLRRGTLGVAMRTWRTNSAAEHMREQQARALGALHNVRTASAWRAWRARTTDAAQRHGTAQRELRRIVRFAWQTPCRQALRTWREQTLLHAAMSSSDGEVMAQSQLDELLRQHRVHASRVAEIHADELDALRSAHAEAVAAMMQTHARAIARHRAREEKALQRADAASADAAQQRRLIATVTRECDERIEVALRRHAAEKGALLEQMRAANRKNGAGELRDWQSSSLLELRGQEEKVRARMQSIAHSLDAMRREKELAAPSWGSAQLDAGTIALQR